MHFSYSLYCISIAIGLRKASVMAYIYFYLYEHIRACLHGVEDPGVVGLVSFVFTLWGTQNKRNLRHYTGVPHSM